MDSMTYIAIISIIMAGVTTGFGTMGPALAEGRAVAAAMASRCSLLFTLPLRALDIFSLVSSLITVGFSALVFFIFAIEMGFYAYPSALYSYLPMLRLSVCVQASPFLQLKNVV